MTKPVYYKYGDRIYPDEGHASLKEETNNVGQCNKK